MLTASEGNQKIKEMILSGAPFCAGKIGNSEHWALVQYLADVEEWNREIVYFVTVIAGVFPPDQASLEKFAEVFCGCLDQVDLSAKWLKIDDQILKIRNPAVLFTELRGLEPYYHPRPWSHALAGKKVLVLSPFTATIRRQFARRESVWAHRNIIPALDLELVKTPLSSYLVTSPYRDWFDGLEKLKRQIDLSDAQIVLTGCGAWSLPLAAYAKEIGKQGIHLGGATQILFGIKGRRWDQHEVIAGFYNPNWVRPAPDETPDAEKIRMVENGCYW